MDFIQSKDNKLIKEIKKLKERKYRDNYQKFFIEGFRFVEEAFKAHAKVDCLLVSETQAEKYMSFLESVNLKDKYIVKDNLFRDICSTENPQGMAAVISKAQQQCDFSEGLIVLTDKVQDPGNMGTIIRTAHAVGAKAVIYSLGTVDPYNEKTLRSTMGSIFYLPIIEDKNLELVSQLLSQGYKLVASSLKAEDNFYDVKYGDKIIIAVGNEGNGISDKVEAMADIKVKIPMPGGAESLNVSVAASVMLYEVLRQNLK
ncbi:MAG: RNA methyltransferase [Clostridiales bacterium]|nr:RNA methyltransferase [Clostridiales bacterium]SCN21451.1 putative TrmH family tRNA/rRNA methyltransferase [Clostridium sp. N3C]